jgi:hypothetical protein
MPKLFISYRRADSIAITGRIHDRLVQQFGQTSIFRDIDSIAPGMNFPQKLHDALSESDVLLAVIGEQ